MSPCRHLVLRSAHHRPITMRLHLLTRRDPHEIARVPRLLVNRDNVNIDKSGQRRAILGVRPNEFAAFLGT